MSDCAPILVVRVPHKDQHPYDVVLRWIQVNHPQIAGHFDLVALPGDMKPADPYRLVVFWLQDPLYLYDPPRYEQALAIAGLCDQKGIATINRPECQSPLVRTETYRRLANAGITTPIVRPFSPPESILPAPFLLRENFGHQRDCALIADDVDEDVLARLHEPVAAEFIDVRSEDGRYRKFRCIVIGDTVISHHLQISEGWLTQGGTRITDITTREEEIEYISAPDPHEALMKRVREVLGADFLAIDYGIDQRGEVVIWEANQYPFLHFSKFGLTYRNFAMDRTIAAMTRHYLRAAAIEVPNKLGRQASYDC